MKPAKRFDDLKLAQQSILLIAVLLLGEIFFVIALFMQLQSAANEALAEARLNEFSRRSQMLIFKMHDFIHSLEIFVTTKSSQAAAEIDESERRMTEESIWLIKNFKHGYPQLSEKTEQLFKTYKKFFKAVNSTKSKLDEMAPEMLPIFFMAVLQKVEPMRHAMQKESVDLLAQEEELLQELPEQQAATRERLRAIIFAGIAANVMIVFALTVFFLKRIAGRLSFLVRNTRNLAAGRQMHPALSGRDELAGLDRAMHSMADSIAAARKERQEFLAMVSHELRTPLNSVSGSLEILTMGALGELKPHQEAQLLASQKEVAQLVVLINDLLDLEKLESGRLLLDKKVVYLDDVLEAAVQTVAEEAESKNISIEKPEPLAEVLADEARLRQVFVNLLKNSIAYSDSDKTIEIEVEEQAAQVVVQVLDRGFGVPALLQDRLFDRFRKVEDTVEGVSCGMGLPICRHLVILHDGVITYKPREDGGSIFTITIPLAMPPAG